MSGAGVKDQILEQKMVLASQSLVKLQGLRALCEELMADNLIMYLFFFFFAGHLQKTQLTLLSGERLTYCS